MFNVLTRKEDVYPKYNKVEYTTGGIEYSVISISSVDIQGKEEFTPDMIKAIKVLKISYR